MRAAISQSVVLVLVALLHGPALAVELLMVEEEGCHWCEKWNREIGDIYPKTNEGRRAPLRRLDINNLPQDISFASHPVFTPTFILVDDGEELGRLEGYGGDEFFWFLLRGLLDDHLRLTAPGARTSKF